MQQLQQQVLDVLAHVAGFGQGGRVADGKRHVENPSQRPGQQRLAGSGGTDQQDVALGELDVVFLGFFLVPQPLVVVVDGDREHPLGRLLSDHILVQVGLDLAGRGQVAARLARVVGRGKLVANDLVAQVDALVADEDRRPGDQFLHLVLALAAEGAVKGFLAGRAFFLGHGSCLCDLRFNDNQIKRAPQAGAGSVAFRWADALKKQRRPR